MKTQNNLFEINKLIKVCGVNKNLLKRLLLQAKVFFILLFLFISSAGVATAYPSQNMVHIKATNAPFTGGVVELIGDQNGQGFVFGQNIYIGGSEGGWKVPVGSYFCLIENKLFLGLGTYMYRFKVTSYSSTENSIVLAGTVFHSWITGYTPNLLNLGWLTLDDYRRTNRQIIEYCKTGKDH